MKNFIKLRSLLDRIPKTLYDEANEAEFLESMMDGFQLLPNVIQYEPKIELFEIIDGRVELPKELKQVNSVHYQCIDPSAECLSELESSCTEEAQDINPDVCRPMITYKMWLDSPYFKETFKILRYRGIDKSLISNSCECVTPSCSESFVITPQKIMFLTLQTGFVCVNYDCPVCDDKGEFLIPDSSILNEFLISYAITKHWEDRQFTKESQASNFYDKYNQKTALLLRQARGELLIRQVNIADIMNIDGQYKKLIKLPELLFYAR